MVLEVAQVAKGHFVTDEAEPGLVVALGRMPTDVLPPGLLVLETGFFFEIFDKVQKNLII